MKILVLGSSGMLGHIVTLYLRQIGHNVTDISRRNKINADTILLDVLTESGLSENMLATFDAIINCTALLVKPSENDKCRAIMLNSWFPHKLEEKTQNTETKVIQVSTDGVFSGCNAPYIESDSTDSLTFYGKTKILGELNNTKDLTIRASFVGPDMNVGGTGLFHWFAMQKGNVNGYDSIMFNAVTSLEYVKFVAFALDENISGIYHLRASETISKSRFLHMAKETFGIEGVSINNTTDIYTDHTLSSIRTDINYNEKSYQEMFDDLKTWMYSNKNLYSHYDFL